MLEIKNLTKVYRSKTGNPVKALDNVSISFPETGMVFILGKSGSGKSTLLNVIGGLDAYDSGEFIIKGKSSKQFGGSDFDAYRNTFIGFIFQEYNVLDDFSVGANIGLALELQGKKATDEKINAILKQVDLVSFAKRKPNELSGGQKQRVAIARALVKDPQIIMADEPTGALDSNTGKQIFDTLKELSREKLVLIVSHDRDFAERYADRIIELSDGKILSDVTKHEHRSVQLSEGIQQINSRILRIKGGYRLTENDLQMINEYLQRNKNDIILSGDGRINEELRSAAGISTEGNTEVFENTDEKDVALKSYEKKDSKFIRSSLPIKNALRMGVSGLKHKKFRLAMTIFLSLIAFALFGFADTLGAYEKETAAVASVMDSGITSASVRLGVKHTYIYDGEESEPYYSYAPMNDADIQYLREQTGMDFVPVFTGGDEWNGGFSLSSQFKEYSNDSEVYTGKLTGLVTMNESQVSNAGLRLVAGSLPKKQGEIAITELMVRQFNEYGFISTSEKKNEEIAAGSVTADKLIGKHVTIGSSYGGFIPNQDNTITFKIVGVVDTGFDYTRYQTLLPPDENSPTVTEETTLATMVLAQEVRSELNYGFHALGFAHKKDIETAASMFSSQMEPLSQYMSGFDSETYIVLKQSTSQDDELDKEELDQAMYEIQFRQLAGSDAAKKLNVVWLNDSKKLGKNQILVSQSTYLQLITPEIKREVDPDILESFIEKPDDDIQYESYGYRIAYSGNSANKLAAARYVAGLFGVENVPPQLQDKFFDLLDRVYEGGDLTVALDYYTLENYFFEYLVLTEEVGDRNLRDDEDLVDSYFEYFDQEGWYDGIEDSEKENLLFNYYCQYLRSYDQGQFENEFGDLSGSEIQKMAQKEAAGFFPLSDNKLTFKHVERSYETDATSTVKKYQLEIVGYYISNEYSDMIVSDTLLADYEAWYKEAAKSFDYGYEEIVAEHEDGIWGFAVAPMGDEAALRKLVQMTYDEEGDLNFALKNSVMETLGSFNEFIEIGAKIFMYIGIGFAVFSALLLMNFISTSIAYKKREIGILRAVGARSSDVFKIFFSEALVIALINFLLSSAAVVAIITLANTLMRSQGINITLLTFGIRQVILMLGISVGVALLASFLPVYKIAKRKPVDAIKNL